MGEKLSIDKIKVSDDRHRKEFDQEKLQSLADSIKKFGIIEPIIIEKDGRLIAGERRLRASKMAGLTEVDVIFKEGLDEWHRRALELEENIQREDLTWPEECEAKLQVHELYQDKFGAAKERKKDSGWTLQDTAELLGESHGSTVQDIQLARALRVNPELKKKDTKVSAFKALKVTSELSMKRELAGVFAGLAEAKGESPIQVRLGDSVILLKEYEDESFDFCVTDPQYGIGVHDMQDTFPNRGDVRQGIEFDDSRPILQSIVKPVMEEVYRILKEGSHCYVFFAIARYTEVRKILEEVGFWVCPTPLFWIKNNALNLRPWITYPVNYEPIFYCAKGYPPRPLTTIQPLSTFDHPILVGTKVHPTEKPLLVIKWLIGNCSEPKEKGIDPFLGGGTFTLACKEMGRLGVGVEIDEIWWMEAKKKIENETSETV
jgi:ParB/RepB/Spo0J family partition protein